jgi:hypothetical protein
VLTERANGSQLIAGALAPMPLGVTGNTPDSGSGESWFEPRRGNGSRDSGSRLFWGSAFSSRPSLRLSGAKGGDAERGSDNCRSASSRSLRSITILRTSAISLRPGVGISGYARLSSSLTRIRGSGLPGVLRELDAEARSPHATSGPKSSDPQVGRLAKSLEPRSG